MKGWKELSSDVNWVDYHGAWARRAPDGSWYVLRWTNLLDAGGREFEATPFECEVKRVVLASVLPEEIDSALRSCGWRLENGTVVSECGDTVTDEFVDLCIVECCIGYGLGEPLETFTGAKHPMRIRAKARRYAERCMKDAALLESRLDRPVNKIGSTAREYGRGDIDSALHRGPFDMSKQIIRKMHGLPPVGDES